MHTSFPAFIFHLIWHAFWYDCSPISIYFQIISQKPINDICGYEESDGQICRYSSFPQHEISPFLDELAVLLTSMLNSDANGLPSFEDFFHQAKDNYGYWRAMNNWVIIIKSNQNHHLLNKIDSIKNISVETVPCAFTHHLNEIWINMNKYDK